MKCLFLRKGFYDMIRKEMLIDMILELTPEDANQEIRDDTNIIEDLKFDSLAMVELLNRIEEKFSVDFTELPDFLERFEYVNDIWEGIEILMRLE